MKIRPNIFLIADTHFGHKGIVSHGWREIDHEEETVQRWNKVVGEDDVVLHLGDLSLSSKNYTIAFTERLKGRKYLILGNHDEKSDKWYEDVGFTVIPPAIYRVGENYVAFTHEPIVPLGEGWWNIHGHLHGNDHREIATSRFHLDVGVDVVSEPVRLSALLEILNRRQNGFADVNE